jgi:hypothetical protein
LRGEELK